MLEKDKILMSHRDIPKYVCQAKEDMEFRSEKARAVFFVILWVIRLYKELVAIE